MENMPADRVHLDLDEARALGEGALRGIGYDEEEARIITEHVIDAVAATAEDARLLGVRPRVPMLRERRLTTDLAGTPVEWSDDRYLGGAVAFSVRNSVAVNALSRTPRS